ncbi:MAG: hypothetical protein WC619_02010 [Patescibacteria group bacterium]
MRKILFSLALAVLVGSTSWQMYFVGTNRLIVHTTPDPASAVCYDGPAEDYNGYCVSPAAPTTQYLWKQHLLSLEK